MYVLAEHDYDYHEVCGVFASCEAAQAAAACGVLATWEADRPLGKRWSTRYPKDPTNPHGIGQPFFDITQFEVQS